MNVHCLMHFRIARIGSCVNGHASRISEPNKHCRIVCCATSMSNEPVQLPYMGKGPVMSLRIFPIMSPRWQFAHQAICNL